MQPSSRDDRLFELYREFILVYDHLNEAQGFEDMVLTSLDAVVEHTITLLTAERKERLLDRSEFDLIVYTGRPQYVSISEPMKFIDEHADDIANVNPNKGCTGGILYDVSFESYYRARRRHPIGDGYEYPEEELAEIANTAFDECFKRDFLAPIEFQQLISQLPSEYVMPDTELAKEITNDHMDGEEFAMVVKPKRKPSDKPVVTKAILTFNGDQANIMSAGRSKYTPYDRAVYSGIVSLYEANNELFTPAMVYRAMNGLSESEYVSPTTLEKVANSIEKSRRSQLVIDFTDEARFYAERNMVPPGSDFKTTYEGNLLAADKITIRNNGLMVTGYKILRKPILYEYAQAVNQVISVPIGLLQTKGGVRSTEEVIVLREYLLRRIESFRRRRQPGSLVILYDEIYKLHGISKETHKNYKDKCKKIRSHTEAILGEWLNMCYIEGFESRRDGTRSINSIEIIV